MMIGAERASLVTALAALDDADWAKPSLCAGRTVRDTVGHIVATASLTPPKFIGGFVGSGFNFAKFSDKGIQKTVAGRSNADLVEALRGKINSHTAPPGPTASWLGETVVHGEDVFRALGDYRPHPIEHVVAVADFYAGSNALIGSKKRIDGVTLVATDADWRHGTGPEVSGPMIALVMAMTGRKVALTDVTGEGVAVLQDR